jgi:hypothetical protein
MGNGGSYARIFWQESDRWPVCLMAEFWRDRAIGRSNVGRIDEIQLGYGTGLRH